MANPPNNSFVPSVPTEQQNASDSFTTPLDIQNTSLQNFINLIIKDKYTPKYNISGWNKGVIVKVLQDPKKFEYNPALEYNDTFKKDIFPPRYKVYVYGEAGKLDVPPKSEDDIAVQLLKDYSKAQNYNGALSVGNIVVVDCQNRTIHYSLDDIPASSTPSAAVPSSAQQAFNNNPAKPLPPTSLKPLPVTAGDYILNDKPKDIGKKVSEVNDEIDNIIASLKKVGITNVNFIAASLANVEKETGFVIKNEYSYSNTPVSRLRKVFGGRLTKFSDTELETLKKDDIAFYDVIYGKDGPLGTTFDNTQRGDGFKYRGRGYIQHTGKSNYKAASLAIYKDLRLVNDPELFNKKEVAAEGLAFFMSSNMKGGESKTGITFDSSLTENNACILATSLVGGGNVKKRVDEGIEIWVQIFSKVQKFFPKYLEVVKQKMNANNPPPTSPPTS